MKGIRAILGALVIGIFLCAMNGCGNAKHTAVPDDQVIARINDYELTVYDFKDESRRMLAYKDIIKDPSQAKKDLLEDIITRKVMLQEAQKENLDKEKYFMKEIERYWEQALIKLLLSKKTAEIPSRLSRENKEKVLEKWADDLRKRAHIDVNKAVLDKIDLEGGSHDR